MFMLVSSKVILNQSVDKVEEMQKKYFSNNYGVHKHTKVKH